MSLFSDNSADTTVAEPTPAVQGLHDQLIGVDHVAIAVTDLNEAIDWYIGKLGFELRQMRTTRGRHTSMNSAVLAAGSAIVVLVQGNEPDSQVTKFVDRFGAGVQHIAFAVRDLDRVMARLTESGGIADTPVMSEPGIRQVFLRRDPGSGVRVELIERRGGDFSDASVDRLFRAFEADDLY